MSIAELTRFLARAGGAVRLRGVDQCDGDQQPGNAFAERRFRGKDKPTDVLSFPPLLDEGNGFAGDVAIRGIIAARNARLLGSFWLRMKLRFWRCHGIVHLAGYDHEHDDGEMAKKEQRLRKSLGLPVGLIERNGTRPEASSSVSQGRVTPKNNASQEEEAMNYAIAVALVLLLGLLTVVSYVDRLYTRLASFCRGNSKQYCWPFEHKVEPPSRSEPGAGRNFDGSIEPTDHRGRLQCFSDSRSSGI